MIDVSLYLSFFFFVLNFLDLTSLPYFESFGRPARKSASLCYTQGAQRIFFQKKRKKGIFLQEKKEKKGNFSDKKRNKKEIFQLKKGKKKEFARKYRIFNKNRFTHKIFHFADKIFQRGRTNAYKSA